MCWMSRNLPVMKTAEEDIPVKKVLRRNLFEALFSPVFGGTEWKLNVIRVTKLDEPHYHNLDNVFSIEYGFHSCENIRKVENCWTNEYFSELFVFDSGEEVFNAIIPKGSEYYKNEEGDYVSNQLMIIGK